MTVNIKRIDQNLPLPQYQTDGAAGFDFVARQDTTIAPQGLAIIPGNVVVQIPQGYMLLVASRSSTARKKGLMLANGVGIIDSDYSGPEDEIGISVYNFTDQAVTVERGERIAQGIFVSIATPQIQEIESIEGQSRGGFGSTGTHAEAPHNG